MKMVLNWMKSNPITVASVVVIILALGVIGYFRVVLSADLREQIETRKSEISQIDAMQRKSIEVPPANPDDPPETLTGITINPRTLDLLRDIFKRLDVEAEQIDQIAIDINREGHEVLEQGLFPKVPGDLLFSARQRYRDSMATLLSDEKQTIKLITATGLTLPYLNAGLPLKAAHIEDILKDKQAEYMQGRDSKELSEGERKELLNEQRIEVMNLLIQRAQQIHVYADPDLGNNPLKPNVNFPLQISELGKSTEAPRSDQVWEAQLQLWIMQDIIKAMAIANDVANQGEHFNDEGERIESSVLTAPIKRLISVRVLPGYVGIHTRGGVRVKGMRAAASSNDTTAKAYPAPENPTSPPRQTVLRDSFTYGPTGRASNGIWDVRHIVIKAHVDVQKLPLFFNAISEVNLMTLLDAQYEALDEYGQSVLGDMYLYGKGDIVKAEFLIETIWLREWTADLMPNVVRKYLGMESHKVPDPDAKPEVDPNADPNTANPDGMAGVETDPQN